MNETELMNTIIERQERFGNKVLNKDIKDGNLIIELETIYGDVITMTIKNF